MVRETWSGFEACTAQVALKRLFSINAATYSILTVLRNTSSRQLKRGKSSLHRTKNIREKVERPGEAFKKRKRPIGGRSDAQCRVPAILKATPLGKFSRPIEPHLIARQLKEAKEGVGVPSDAVAESVS